MRKIELKNVDDLYAVWVDDEGTGVDYSKTEMNLMLDDLVATYQSTRSRDDLLAELIQKTLNGAGRRFVDGPLTPDEVAEIVRLVGKSVKNG
jgi:hypothetical protein